MKMMLRILMSLLLTAAGAQAREAAAYALGRVGESEQEAVKAFAAAAKDGEEEVRIAAVRALGEMDASAVKPLASVLKNGDARLQREAAKALGELGPAAKNAVRTLARTVKNRKAAMGVRRTAAEALGRIGPNAKRARSALKSALRSGLPEAKDALDRIRAR